MCLLLPARYPMYLGVLHLGCHPTTALMRFLVNESHHKESNCASLPVSLAYYSAAYVYRFSQSVWRERWKERCGVWGCVCVWLAWKVWVQLSGRKCQEVFWCGNKWAACILLPSLSPPVGVHAGILSWSQVHECVLPPPAGRCWRGQFTCHVRQGKGNLRFLRHGCQYWYYIDILCSTKFSVMVFVQFWNSMQLLNIFVELMQETAGISLMLC